MPPALDWLAQEWRALTAVYQQNELADELLAQLIARYSEPHRTYHNLNHIQFMLEVANDLQHLADDWTAVRLAIWFHDAVYEPGATDNEQLSAQFARDCCGAFQPGPDNLQKVEDIILATHLSATGHWDNDTYIVLDADLAILGTNPLTYAGYAQAIRQEFAFVSDEDFKQGRSAVLLSFLERDRIYYLDECTARFAARARLNLAQELADLRS